MTVRVRELQKGDGLVWRELRLRALGDDPDAFGMTYEMEAQRLDEEWKDRIDKNVADPFVTYLVAQVDNDLAGLAACAFDETDRSMCHLFAMWVAPEFRRRGVGRSLVASSLDWMNQRRATVAQLGVTEGNEAALSLYSSFGFVDTGNRDPLREGSPLQVIVMRRQLGELMTGTSKKQSRS